MLTFHQSIYMHAIHHPELSFPSLILDSAFYVMFPVLKRFRSELRPRNAKKKIFSPPYEILSLGCNYYCKSQMDGIHKSFD